MAGTGGGLYGVNPNVVLQAIAALAKRFRSGDRTPDGRKLDLVIEGGRMRGVCSAGAAVALEHLDFT